MLRATVFVMEYLSTLDAGFLEVEDSGPHVSLAVGALAVLEGPRCRNPIAPGRLA